MAERSPTTDSHIVLIGMRGSGKTTVGRRVAAALGREHIDTDQWVVESCGKSIAELFTSVGEAGFRKLEREAVAEAVGRSTAVISVGGGAVLDAANVKALRDTGLTVWLTAPAGVLYERIQADNHTSSSRPALSDLPGVAEVETLLRLRAQVYKAAADVAVDTAGRSPDVVASLVIQSAGGPPV